MSSERQTQSLREVHQRLVSYVAAHSNLCNATMALADSIVDFYLPEVGAGESSLLEVSDPSAAGVDGVGGRAIFILDPYM